MYAPYLYLTEKGIEVTWRGITVTCKRYDELLDHLSLLHEKHDAPAKCISSSSLNHPEDYPDLDPEILEMVEKTWEW